MAKNVRVWRYLASSSQWRNISSRGVITLIDAQDVELDPMTARLVTDKAWLLEAKAPGSPVPQTLVASSILNIIEDSWVPSNATLWGYRAAEERFTRVYRRSNAAANTKVPPPHINAAGIDCEDGDLVLDIGADDKAIHITLKPGSAAKRESVEIEVVSGDVSTDSPYSGIAGSEFQPMCVKFLLSKAPTIREQVAAAGLAVQANDPEGFELAAQALFESFTGATPGSTQGTNVIHQLNAAADDCSKVVFAIQDHSKATSSASGAQGGFAGGVASVDATWQALASVLSLVRDIFVLGSLFHEAKNVSASQEVDFTKLKVGRGATAASNVLKSYSSIGSTVSAISTISSGASILSVGVATSVPAVGAVAGLATMVRSSHQAEKARKRAKRIKAVMALAADGEVSAKTQALLAFSMGKAIRRHRFKAAEATVGAGSTAAGTCLAVGAALAGANAWNPVGWGLGAVVVVAGTGLLAYKIHRKRKSKKRAKKRGFKTAEFPSKLVYAYVEARRADSDGLETEVLGALLESYGVEPEWLHMNRSMEVTASIDGIRDAIFRIERHLS